MVYYGKPSKACLECRTRRTRCDALLPSCSQCTRASRLCGGYIDPSDSIFRDESLNVQKKHQDRQKKTGTKCSSSISKSLLKTKPVMKSRCAPSSQIHAFSQTMASISLPLGAGTTLEDQAICFFFSNYILTDDEPRYGSFQYIRDIYNSERVGTALSEILVALGLAGLSTLWRAPDIMLSAHKKYSSAVRLINLHLSDNNELKSDQTFVAVLALSLYETNTCCRPASMKSWTEHINGALQILYLRGKERLQTPIGRQLFIHLRRLVITSCIQRQVPVPSTMDEWSISASSEDESTEEIFYTALSQLNIKFANIRASLSSFHDYSNNENTIASLEALDIEYQSWLDACPAIFEYMTVRIQERSTEVFSDSYHIYSSMGVAAVWNNYRCVRILVNELLLTQINYKIKVFEDSATLVPSFLWEQQTRTRSTVLQLSHDICATVPFFLSSPNPTNGVNVLPPKAITGNMLIWPLYIAACTGLVSSVMRDWIVGRLSVISEVLGIGQAAPLAHTLSLNRDLLEWAGNA